ncbi:GNAT family N-acetyltransferase [Haladaptatus cibarius]|uniref:GNAT family N-acetyltransferase n=1 Tax=Haladaptatus cibarius TaxID=453847 RepID=UPI000678DF0E|nr:GNAT family N-acetyltransferase [Haladaptatus cibarius]
MVTIEAATSGDMDTVTDLWVELACDQRAHGSHFLPDENRDTIRDSVARHVIENTLLVARETDIVGFVMFDLQSGMYEQATTRGIIQNVYVEPEHRDSGIGSELLDAAETALVERGAERLALEVMAKNKNARRLYQSRGYEPHRIELEKSVENDNHSKE